MIFASLFIAYILAYFSRFMNKNIFKKFVHFKQKLISLLEIKKRLLCYNEKKLNGRQEQ
jgi:hypothetical protein